MELISDPAKWSGALPVVLAAPADGRPARRTLLRALAARALGRPAEAVEILHAEGRAPVLVQPAESGLHLSSASRGSLAVAALARTPIGVDVERVEPGTEPPWNVLHPDERRWLEALAAGERDDEFARLWAGKEAYLKALGIGLVREPSSFAVLPCRDDPGCTVRDPERAGFVHVATAWVTQAGHRYAVAAAQVTADPSRDTTYPGQMPG
jgi:4'-phosphopantetheinyl transferase